MSSTWTRRGRPAGLFLAVAIGVSAFGASANGADLRTLGNSFTSDSHYVSATVFTWFDSAAGQVSGPWRPVEGRSNWTGTPAFWQTQVKQMMAANIDVLQVELYSDYEGTENYRRSQLFQALYDLRVQGYNVPKVTPFLDTYITTAYGWTSDAAGTAVNLGTTDGKDAFVKQFTKFYNQYYGLRTDPYADSYLAQIDGRVVMDTWHLNSECGVQNPGSMSRSDMRSRLVSSLGSNHAIFNNLTDDGIFMIRPASSSLGFADEKLAQFEVTSYYNIQTYNGRQAVQAKAGYWDQNIRTPGSFLARNGGVPYAGAWSSVQAARSGGLKHVNVESWNEYDEGSGIYAANPGAPYTVSSNTNTDTWSSTNDPYEYIKTTAAGARLFNDTPDRDATILYNNLPTTMTPGQTGTYQVTVRNEGDVSWTGADGFKLGGSGSVLSSSVRCAIDDATNEIPTYGGIFRGRPVTFDVELTAPTTLGTYATQWQMLEEGTGWFGDALAMNITVAVPEPATLTLLATGLLAAGCCGWHRRRAGKKGKHS